MKCVYLYFTSKTRKEEGNGGSVLQFVKYYRMQNFIHRISPNIMGFIFKYCFLERKGGPVFGLLIINMTTMSMRSSNSNSNDICENTEKYIWGITF
jgi:hypothetical protein